MNAVRLIPKSNEILQGLMKRHYSMPKGFVGRQVFYLVENTNKIYGAIGFGSATLYLPGRNEFFNCSLNEIANNIFYHIEKVDGKYPSRNFSSSIINLACKQVMIDWQIKYNVKLKGFETLVELPRTGECYLRDGWKITGITKGMTCKRGPGKGTDSWSGKKVWNMKQLKPKLVLCKIA